MLFAGDVGGTKTLLGLFERADRRPAPRALRSYATSAFPSFVAVLDAFVRDVAEPFTVDAAVLGVAGPVIGSTARLTNIAWNVASHDLTDRFGTRRVQLMNDLEAMATSVDRLVDDEVVVLQEGVARIEGNVGVIAAGTGLGQACLHRIDGRLAPVPSEGGHADFAARTDREIELVKMLRELYGRAEVEQVLSGPGLINLHRLTHRHRQCDAPDGAADAAARVSQAGLDGRCQPCVEALQMFVSAYGAEAGNLALRAVTTAGLYVGGGIAPKILPMLGGGLFMEAFLAKPPMTKLLSNVPVKVILSPDAGLLGAAVRAQQLVGQESALP